MRKALAIFSLAFLLVILSACGPSSETASKEEASNSSESTQAAIYSDQLRNSFNYSLKAKADTNLEWAFFIDDDSIQVNSDSNYENLEISARSYISNEDKSDFNLGRTLAVPQDSKTSLPDTNRAKIICGKDVLQSFAEWSVFLIKYDLPLPKVSLKISIEYYTLSGEATKDKFGNTDSSTMKEVVLGASTIKISNSNLASIANAMAPDDYYKLSDLAAPARHPKAWDRCTSQNL
jgi:hypothetical protein